MTLPEKRELMLRYLQMKLEEGDLHGVQDAASDIREIDARLDELAKSKSRPLDWRIPGGMSSDTIEG